MSCATGMIAYAGKKAAVVVVLQDTLGAPAADIVTLEDHCQFK